MSDPDDTRGTAGHDASAPNDLRKRSWTYALRSSVREFSRDQCMDLAAALTYYAVLASAPAALALVSVLGLVGDPEQTANKVLDVVGSIVPEDANAVIEPIIEQVTSGAGKAGVALVVGLVVALWSASGYVGAFGRALNRIYDVDEGRPVWKLRPLLLGITLLTVVLAAVVMATLVLSGPVARAIGEAIGLGDAAITVWNVAKWPVVVLLVIVIVAVLYHATPNVRRPRFRWIGVGAVVAILVWVLASAPFGFYVSNFGSYGSTYGTLAGIIVFLLWLWITNLALLFGAELDAALERGRELRSGLPAEESVQLPPRDTRASEKRERKRRKDVARGRSIREDADLDPHR